ncbi:15635_t:CDS:2, partial [Racocetra persica]
MDFPEQENDASGSSNYSLKKHKKYKSRSNSSKNHSKSYSFKKYSRSYSNSSQHEECTSSSSNYSPQEEIYNNGSYKEKWRKTSSLQKSNNKSHKSLSHQQENSRSHTQSLISSSKQQQTRTSQLNEDLDEVKSELKKQKIEQDNELLAQSMDIKVIKHLFPETLYPIQDVLKNTLKTYLEEKHHDLFVDLSPIQFYNHFY